MGKKWSLMTQEEKELKKKKERERYAKKKDSINERRRFLYKLNSHKITPDVKDKRREVAKLSYAYSLQVRINKRERNKRYREKNPEKVRFNNRLYWQRKKLQKAQDEKNKIDNDFINHYWD